MLHGTKLQYTAHTRPQRAGILRECRYLPGHWGGDPPRGPPVGLQLHMGLGGGCHLQEAVPVLSSPGLGALQKCLELERKQEAGVASAHGPDQQEPRLAPPPLQQTSTLVWGL